MKLKILWLIFFCTSIIITACGVEKSTSVAKTPTMPATPTQADLCSEENLPAEVARINKLMREFDDYSALASNTPQGQLVVIIPELQRVLREAEDISVPSCLNELKELQVSHMDVVVRTLMAFMGNSDAQLVNAGISQARDLHLQYDIEMARLLGVTLIVPTFLPTFESDTEESTINQAVTVFNPGPNGVNIRSMPDFNAPQAGVLAIEESVSAVGRTADNQWILVEIPSQPGQIAWIYASLVEPSTSIENLPVVKP